MVCYKSNHRSRKVWTAINALTFLPNREIYSCWRRTFSQAQNMFSFCGKEKCSEEDRCSTDTNCALHKDSKCTILVNHSIFKFSVVRWNWVQVWKNKPLISVKLGLQQRPRARAKKHQQSVHGEWEDAKNAVNSGSYLSIQFLTQTLGVKFYSLAEFFSEFDIF